MKRKKRGQQMLEHLFLVMATLVLVYVFIEQRFREDVERVVFTKGFSDELRSSKNFIDNKFELNP